MQISKLRLSGFKSFVQPTELFIEPGLTGVVGPNGCGKSNLVDALRWVMGESSARGLRGGEMDDVIFAGTHARAPFDLAEVALQLQAGGEPIPGFEDLDELELTRRIGRGLGSVYRVNGAEVRAKDIQLLFADAASGARSAAIVSQGRIGALVEAKPLERRKLLEEAAGISGLQARRHEAELKLRGAETNLIRVEDLLVNLDEQFAALQKQARQAERYRKLQEQHRETEAALLIGRWQVARTELEQAEEALRTGRGHVQIYAGRLAEAREKREQATESLTDFRRDEAGIATELVRLGERLSAIDAEAARLDANQARLSDQERQTVQDLEHAEAAKTDAKSMVDKLSGEHRVVVELIEQGDAERQRGAVAEADAREALERIESQFRERLAARADAEAGLKQAEARAAQLNDEQQALSSLQQELDGRLHGLAEAPASFDGAPPTDNAAVLESALADGMAASAAADGRLMQADDNKTARDAALTTATATQRAAEEAVREREAAIREADTTRQSLAERGDEFRCRIERLEQRSQELSTKVEERNAERSALDTEAAAAHVAEIGADIEAISERLLDAERSAEEAKSSAEISEIAFQAAQSALGKLDAEASALADLVNAEVDGPSIADRIEVQDGYTDALAAALGDDLLGGEIPEKPTHWRSEVGSAPLPEGALPLPEGCVPLAEKVAAPPALRRRLAQVGLVDHASAERLQQALHQGQRLVTAEGGLWRWDGLVRLPEGVMTAAARLKQQARHRELEGELAKAGNEQDNAATELASRHDRQAAALAAAKALETERETCRLTAEAARHTLGELRSKEAAITAELGPLSEEMARLTAERSDLQCQAEETERQLQALSGDQADDAALSALRETLTTATARHQAARLAAEEAAREQAQARQDTALARKRVLEAQERLEASRAKERRHAALLQERAVERAQIEVRASRLNEDRQQLDQRLAIEAGLNNEAETTLGAASKELETAEAALELARQRHAEARAADVALRDRHATASQQAAALAADLSAWEARIDAADARVRDLAQRRRQIVAELADLAALPDDLVRQQTELRARIGTMERKRSELADAVAQAEQTLADAETALQQVENEQVEARESGARLEAHLERAEAEVEATEAAVRSRLGEGIETMPGEPPSPEALAELETRLARIEASRERLGAVNLRAIEEAQELEMRIQTLRTEQDELTQAIERLRRAISTLNREGRERLRTAFGEVEKHFEALFVRLFGGGRAKIELTDMEDPLNAGLELSASPPGKKLQSLSLLSGGEKALTAIALIFAVFLTRPSPLCLLDEVDAPLDDANVNRLGMLLEELTQATRTRFVVVTHHPMTMARMDRLYGVTMVERGVSQLVGVDLRTAEELRATA
ncbi:MAG: AAA family ATPase [Geminicoccaceae bacterium]